MPPSVTGRRLSRWVPSVLVLMAFVGTWLGHTLEYLRVDGAGGLVRTMTGSVHVYMLPLGLVLLVGAVVGGIGWLKVVTDLADRLQRLRGALYGGRRVDLTTGPVEAGPAARLCSVWLTLATAQLGLYLVQENLESVAAGRRAAVFGPVLSHHWAAAPIHLAVACALATLAVPLLGYRRRLERAVRTHERLVARLWGSRRLMLAVPVPVLAPVLTPHQRWGSQRWQRPPPESLAA